MGADSKIEWCDHTFNPWLGCTRLSPACDHCYAEGWARRTGQAALWDGERRWTTPAYWREAHRWNRRAAAAGSRPRVFCASLADVFDNQVPERWRDDLWHLIDQTPQLDWLLLTKRPQNIAKMLPGPKIGAPAWGDGWPNVWLGTTVENQEEADRRIPPLLAAPAAVHFLSCEPLLGAVDLEPWLPWPLEEREVGGKPWGCIDCELGDCDDCPAGKAVWVDHEHGPFDGEGAPSWVHPQRRTLDWVIVGGESGPKARPMHPDWARSLRDQCAAAGVPFFMKQWGEWGLEEPVVGRHDAFALANDGTLYRMADLAFPDGKRRGEAIRANHDRAHLHSIYRVGKKTAGRLLDGVEHNGMPASANASARLAGGEGVDAPHGAGHDGCGVAAAAGAGGQA